MVMLVGFVLALVLVGLIAAGVVMSNKPAPVAAPPKPPMRLALGDVAPVPEPTVDLMVAMSGPDSALYVPVDTGRKFFAVAGPETWIEGRVAFVPSQLAGVAVAGQSGLEALVRDGHLTGRLVTVDPSSARAIHAGATVKDSSGAMIGLIKGNDSGINAGTRIKPLAGGLVRSAAGGPALLSAIAMQAQLAQVERTISEARDTGNAIQGYLEASERAAVSGRRAVLATVYRTAHESGAMTQTLWDQIHDLEAPLRRDVTMADGELARAIAALENGAQGFVGQRLRSLAESGPAIGAAVAGVADARRSLVQFSALRLWWIAVTDDQTLASRQAQLREQLAELPTHADERLRTANALAAVVELKRHHRAVAPRKQKALETGVQIALADLQDLPWRVVDVRAAGELRS